MLINERGPSQPSWPPEIVRAAQGRGQIRNLYLDTVDLRRLLAEVPGVAVGAGEGGYALRCGAAVEFTEE